ncbi:MAG: AMP-binding protein [Bacteroidetes bacterium]|nr:AMP-binding protein [Bacteroidota bacterium]
MAITNFLSGQIQQQDTYDYTLTDILKLRAQETPGKTAYIYLLDGETEEVVITYQELDRKARTIAATLLEGGMTGERALMLYPPGPEFIFALYGCFYAGVIAVPAYPPRKNKSIERILIIVRDSGAKMTLTTRQIINNIERNSSEFEELNHLKWLVTDEMDWLSDPIAELPVIAPASLAYLQYTSGSTGHPKGAMVTHTNIMRSLEYIRQSFELSVNSVSVSWLPVFHDMGLVAHVFQPVNCGFLGVIMPPVSFLQKPVRWLKAITKYKATFCGAPNFAYDLCVDNCTPEDRKELDLSSLKTLYNGAEPVRKSTLERFVSTFQPYGFRLEMFYPCYGMAETTLIIAGGFATERPYFLPVYNEGLEKHKVIAAPDEEKSASILVGVGHPWIDTVVKIVDPKTNRCCSENVVGEIWVSGSIVTNGYWNRQDETEVIFHAHTADSGEGPFLRTGDLGFFYNNQLFISGRLKDLIIIHGRNYYPQDLEYVAEASHPAVRPNCSAAFAVDVDDEEKVVVVAEVEREYLRNLEGLCGAIRQAVSEEFEIDVYAVQLLRTASIPKTSSGKIQRSACRKGFLENTLNAVGSSILETKEYSKDIFEVHPTGSMLDWLTSWISTKFKIDRNSIDVQKPITVYGLNSMKAVELQKHFLDIYGINFPPYLFFDKISIKELAEKAENLINESRKA